PFVFGSTPNLAVAIFADAEHFRLSDEFPGTVERFIGEAIPRRIKVVDARRCGACPDPARLVDVDIGDRPVVGYLIPMDDPSFPVGHHHPLMIGAYPQISLWILRRTSNGKLDFGMGDLFLLMIINP